MKGAIQSLDASCLVHEIEDMAGHFGNRIRKASLHLHGEDATKSFHGLVAAMPEGLRGELVRDIDRSLDEHSSFYVRFDKQRLVQGELALGTGDVVRIKVKPRAFLMHGRARDFFVGQLEGR